MAHLLVLVLNNVDLCPAVLDAWQEAGAVGATVLQSTGPGRLQRVIRDDLPLMPSLRDLLETHELHHRTLLTVIEDEETLQRVIEASQKVVGDFDQPHTGLLFVVPVERALGLKKAGRRPVTPV